MKALSHAQSVVVNRLAMPIGAFLVLVAIGRHSDALLGQYALVMTFYFIMQMVPLLGLTTYVMREVARAPHEAGRYLSTIGALSMLGCVVVDAGAAVLVGRLAYPPEVKQAIAIVGVLIFPGILLFIAEIIFMGVHRTRPIAWVAIAENVVRVAASIACLAAGLGLLSLFWVFLATRVAALVAYLVCLRRMGLVPRWEPVDGALMRRTTRLLPTFLAGTLLLAIFSRLDFFVLSLYEPVESIGYYAIAYRPFEITIMMLTALLMAIFPTVARRFAHAPRHYAAASRGVVLGFGAALAAVSVAGVLVAPDYVFLLFHKQYPRPVGITQLFMAGVLLAGLDFVAGALLHAADRQHADTRAMTFGGLAQVGLLLLLVPEHGLIGAFVAKLVATCVQASLKLAWLARAFPGVVAWRDLGRGIVVTVALGACTWLALPGPWWVRWIAAIVLVFVALPALALAVGLVQPLRWLRGRWRPRHATEATTFDNLLDLIVADAREHDRRAGANRGRMDRPLAAVIGWRVGRWLHLNDRTGLASAWGRCASFATGCAIDPASAQMPRGVYP